MVGNSFLLPGGKVSRPLGVQLWAAVSPLSHMWCRLEWSVLGECFPKSGQWQIRMRVNRSFSSSFAVHQGRLEFWSSHCGSVVMNLTSIHEDSVLIPGFAQWVKDPTLLWAVLYVADEAWIWPCCGCGVGWQLQLWFDPLVWELPFALAVSLKKTKKRGVVVKVPREATYSFLKIYLLAKRYYYYSIYVLYCEW